MESNANSDDLSTNRSPYNDNWNNNNNNDNNNNNNNKIITLAARKKTKNSNQYYSKWCKNSYPKSLWNGTRE